MGGLTLWREISGSEKTARVERLSGKGNAQGPVVVRYLKSGNWTISLAAKFLGQPPALFVMDDNNFAASVGTLVYRGMKGDEAAKAVFFDFDAAPDFWDEIYGSFCIVICKGGELRLIPDRMGVYPLFCDEGESVISSSFLDVLETIERPTINPQALYEYVFQGATYGRATVVDQVRLMERGCTFRLNDRIVAERTAVTAWDGPRWSGLDHHLDITIDALRREFQALGSAFGDNIDTALSGGYDSRLILCLLRDQGVSPRLHVYGALTDPDVAIAKQISAEEGFQLIHSDKSLEPLPTPDRFCEIIRRNFELFDGYPSDGIFDAGADACTRLERAAGGALALNGGGGEIFRNFFYLLDRPFTIRDVISGFFSQFDPIVCTDEFDELDYVRGMARSIADVLDLAVSQEKIEATVLTRAQVEYLYPYLRCVYWMGRNNGVNNRIGFATTPFIEPGAVRLALQIPIQFKNHGAFEAAMIDRIDPALARHPSTYGRSFSEAPSLSSKLKDYSTMLRPPSLRRLTYRIQNRQNARHIPPLLGGPYLKSVIDPDLPILRRYFRTEQVRSNLEYNRICTLEYLFEKRRVQPR